jgi:hypothetical protein
MKFFRKHIANGNNIENSSLVRCEKCKTFYSRNSIYNNCPICHPSYDKENPTKGYLDMPTLQLVKKFIKITFFVELIVAIVLFVPPIKDLLVQWRIFIHVNPILLLILILSAMLFLPLIGLVAFNEKLELNLSWKWKVALTFGTLGMLYFTLFAPYRLFTKWDYAGWNANFLFLSLLVLYLVFLGVLLWFYIEKKQYIPIVVAIAILLLSGHSYISGIKNANMQYGTSYISNKKILDPILSNGKSILLFEYNPKTTIKSFIVSKDGEDYDVLISKSFIACVVPYGEIQLKISIESNNPIRDGFDVQIDKFRGITNISPKSRLVNYNVDIKKSKLNYLKYDVGETSPEVSEHIVKWGDKVVLTDF